MLVATGANIPGVGAVQSVRATLDATPERLAFDVAAARADGEELQAAARLDLLAGRFGGAEVERFAIRLRGTRWELAAPDRVRWGGVDGVEVRGLTLRQTEGGTGVVSLDGRLPPTGRADLRLSVRDFELAQLLRFVAVPELGGVLALDARIEGPQASPEIVATLAVDSLRYRGVPADRVALNLRYADRRAVIDGGALAGGDTVATFAATVPAEVTLAGGGVPKAQLLRDGPLVARLRADSLPLALFAAVIPGIRDGEGTLRADVQVAGTIARPRLSGVADVVDGGFTLLSAGNEDGERFEGIDGRLTLSGDRVTIDSLRVRSPDTRGSARLSGSVGLADARRPTVDLALDLDQFRVIDRPDVAEITASGLLRLAGRFPSPVLTGQLVVDEGIIQVPEIAGREERIALNNVDVGQVGADTASTALLRSRLAALGDIRIENLVVSTAEGVWLESEDLRAQIETADPLIVSRIGGETRVSGRLEARRGTYRLRIGLLTREFDLVSGDVQFFGTPDLNPRVNIRAANQVYAVDRGGSDELTIFVDITGTLEQLSFRLTSDTRPPLPESELLSYLAFGRSSFGLEQGISSVTQQVVAQELLGNLFASGIEQLVTGVGLTPDYVRVRSRPGRVGGIGELDAGLQGSLTNTTVELGEEFEGLADDLFFTVELGLGGVTGGIFGGGGTGLDQTLRAVGAEYQLDETQSLRLLYEFVRPDELRILPNREPRQQGTMEYRRRWEYGRPQTDPRPVTRPARRSPRRDEDGGSDAPPTSPPAPPNPPPPDSAASRQPPAAPASPR